LLTKSEIKAAGIVQHPHINGERASTYDATVGAIVKRGKDMGTSYVLQPRGVVWVVSQEEFKMPDTITALATVRTTWAHNGVFALNVGVVDPGWNGPIATALVNFSTEPFTVNKDDPFLRLVFLDHGGTQAPTITRLRDDYVRHAELKSYAFADSFLSIDEVANEVTKKIFTGSNIGIWLTALGVLLALISIFAPIAFTVYGSASDTKGEIARLQQRVDELEGDSKKRDNADKEIVRDRERLKALEVIQINPKAIYPNAVPGRNSNP
jgi:deoxycytidine triphosphate deaminase